MRLPLTLISPQAVFILNTLNQAGYDAYIVGGAVRDLLMSLEANEPSFKVDTADYDFTTNAKPEEIQALFPDHFYENTFGTVSVTHEAINQQAGIVDDIVESKTPPAQSNKIIDSASATKLHISLQTALGEQSTSTQPTPPSYQITTYRADEVYDDYRRPTSMNWGSTLEQDLQRRDFTINAMALSKVGQELELIDPFQGHQDLQTGLIKTVGDATTRFQEDALRMLRAIRFSVQLNLRIEDNTFVAIQDHGQLLHHISGERIRDELFKILKSQYPAEGIELLDQSGLLPYILPELEATKGVQQGGHHTTDVWTHSLDALRSTPSPDPVVRLATLLHDIAKPQTYKVINGQITFYNHEVIGARTAKTIAQRLKLSKADTDRIFILVRHHMFYYQPEQTDAAIRRFMRKVGLQYVDDILALREGDRLGSGARKTSWRLEEMKQRMIEQLHQPMDVTDLALNGHDLMTELKLPPGRQIGQILHQLFEMVFENPEFNNRETLLVEARKLLASNN